MYKRLRRSFKRQTCYLIMPCQMHKDQSYTHADSNHALTRGIWHGFINSWSSQKLECFKWTGNNIFVSTEKSSIKVMPVFCLTQALCAYSMMGEDVGRMNHRLFSNFLLVWVHRLSVILKAHMFMFTGSCSFH